MTQADTPRFPPSTVPRHELQKEGKHPAPCARFCEANAFEIEERRLKRENAALREGVKVLREALNEVLDLSMPGSELMDYAEKALSDTEELVK